MKRVCVVCEGQTEVEFVKSCLSPYLLDYDVQAYPAIVQAPSGAHRGGRVTVERLVKFMSHQYFDADRITTLVDFYGFQGRGERNRTQLEAVILEGVLARTRGADPSHVLPYVQMYEFEALLFADTEQFEFVLDGWNDDTRAALKAVRDAFATPEDINDSPHTAPSKRLASILGPSTYSKTEHGPLIAEAIGIARIRAQCPKFDEWVARLQAWGRPRG